jgi:uncharacterized alpha-E superfamily protein
MLSRVAERIYWMSRYLERVENAARLVAVYSELLLDLPEDEKLDWSLPLHILGMDDAYSRSDSDEGELSFLLASQDNIASVLSSMNFARENARTTRDIVPSEAWRAINELHLYAVKSLPGMVLRPSSVVPAEIVGRCHEITGILEGTMSRGPAYWFVQLGRTLERADMSSRTIDVAATILLAGRDELHLHDSTIWRAVLRAQSAYQMYRQYVRRRILGPDVLRFLLRDADFPRSIAHCVSVLEQSLQELPRSELALGEMDSVRTRVDGIDLQTLDPDVVHVFADELQLDLASLHNAIFKTWLDPMTAVRPG